MSAWEEYVAALGEVATAREGAVQQQEQTAQQHLDARRAASERVSATQARIQKLDNRAIALQEHARQTLARTGVSAKGPQTPAEVATPTTGDEAWRLLDELGMRITQTADELTKARADRKKTLRTVGQVLAYVGIPALAAFWVWWMPEGREPSEAAFTFVLLAFAMLTMRRALQGAARVAVVGITAVFGAFFCAFVVAAFTPTATMVFFVVLLLGVIWCFFRVLAQEARATKLAQAGPGPAPGGPTQGAPRP